MIENIIAVGIVAFLFIYLSSKLEKGHFILQLILIFSAMTLLILIPKAGIEQQCTPVINSTSNTTGLTEYTYTTYCYSPSQGTAKSIFYNIFLGIYVVFWIYVLIYFIYKVLEYMGVIVSGKNGKE